MASLLGTYWSRIEFSSAFSVFSSKVDISRVCLSCTLQDQRYAVSRNAVCIVRSNRRRHGSLLKDSQRRMVYIDTSSQHRTSYDTSVWPHFVPSFGEGRLV